MRRWLAMVPELIVVATAAALLMREQSRRRHDVPTTPTPSGKTAPPAAPRGDGETARQAVPDTPEVEEAPESEDSDDVPPKVDLENPASVEEYREYFVRKARDYGEYTGPILFEDAATEMKLEPDQAKELIALYVEYHARSNGASHAPDKSQAQKVQELETLRLDREQALQELLGAAGMKALDRYRRTLSAREQVQELVRNLELSRFRMSEAQRRRLLDALLKPGAYSADREYSPAESPEAVRQEVRARFDQNARQLRDAARRILKPDQFSICVLYLENHRQSAIVEATPYFARDLDAR
jgi:hypothetical protein